ncbi:MAG: nickel pincer cofactor biosynthesis protein LarC [Polyangiaceae bacterium]
MPHDGPLHSHDHPHDHEHGHEHHDHDHPHDHSREHAAQTATLERGAGIGKILFLDAPSGLAGDMIIAALVDLGVPAVVIADAVAKLPITGFHLHFGSRVRSGVVATSFEVHVDDAQPERTYSEIREILDASTLDAETKAAAHGTFLRLAKSEANVHKMPVDGVHFHEVGAIDAIVDVVGSAAALTYLGAKLVVSPLPMGRGFVRARHGVLPLPAPATVECLSGFPTYDAGLEFEFVTPTGAAIVGAHAIEASRWPSFSPQKSGWGAGTADLKDRPNLLRAILGAAPEEETSHVVIETNVDDVTGEIVANCMESLFAAGALDAWATPITMKKGRPALTLSALADSSSADAVANVMIRETTSLGIRRYGVSRMERPRKIVVVKTAFGSIAVKISGGPFGPPQIKPEFDACAAAAKTHGVPVREVIRAALVAASAANETAPDPTTK